MLALNEKARLNKQLALQEQQLALRTKQLSAQRQLAKAQVMKKLATPEAQLGAFALGFVWRGPKGGKPRQLGGLGSLAWTLALSLGKRYLWQRLDQPNQ